MQDLISRQAAIDYFVANVGFHDEDGYEIEDECELRKIWTGYFDGIPPAEPEKRTEERTETHACDCISRQAAIMKILGQPPELHYPSWYAKQIKELPPAEQKRGKWKNIVDGIEYTWGTCDSCGARIPMPYKYYKYCPNCGADMRGEQDG